MMSLASDTKAHILAGVETFIYHDSDKFLKSSLLITVSDKLF